MAIGPRTHLDDEDPAQTDLPVESGWERRPPVAHAEVSGDMTDQRRGGHAITESTAVINAMRQVGQLAAAVPPGEAGPPARQQHHHAVTV